MTTKIDGTLGVDKVQLPAILSIQDLQWVGCAVGEAKHLEVADSPLPPKDSPFYRYILLTESANDTDGYNDNLLINQVVVGEGVERKVTAELNMPESPLHGKVITLRNSSSNGVFLRAGETAGVYKQDQMQRIEGEVEFFNNRGDVLTFSGALEGRVASSPSSSGSGGGGFRELHLDSANSPNARTSDTTAGETAPTHVTAIALLRVI
jgi:hypothetical protein